MPLFRALNLDIPRRFHQRDYPQAEREMRFAETSHVLAFLFALLLAVFALAQRWWGAVAYLILFDVLVNAYPVMLQRYNRGRLLRLTARRRHPMEASGGPEFVSLAE